MGRGDSRCVRDELHVAQLPARAFDRELSFQRAAPPVPRLQTDDTPAGPIRPERRRSHAQLQQRRARCLAGVRLRGLSERRARQNVPDQLHKHPGRFAEMGVFLFGDGLRPGQPVIRRRPRLPEGARPVQRILPGMLAGEHLQVPVQMETDI